MVLPGSPLGKDPRGSSLPALPLVHGAHRSHVASSPGRLVQHTLERIRLPLPRLLRLPPRPRHPHPPLRNPSGHVNGEHATPPVRAGNARLRQKNVDGNDARLSEPHAQRRLRGDLPPRQRLPHHHELGAPVGSVRALDGSVVRGADGFVRRAWVRVALVPGVPREGEEEGA